MKIKIAVTDACIFIDLFDLGLVISFFNLELDGHKFNRPDYGLGSDMETKLEYMEMTCLKRKHES